jgi:hypothetical protein
MPSSGSGAATGVVGDPDLGIIFDWVRHYLRKDEADLPDDNASLVLETTSIVAQLLTIPGYIIPSLSAAVSASCLGDEYSDITGTAKTLFDQASGALIAAKMRPGDLAGAAGGQGPVKRKRTDELETEWFGGASVKASGGETLEASWEREAYHLLLSIDCIQAAAAARAASHPPLFGVAGLTRTLEERGCIPRRRCW